ncbi:MAG: 50S ribosomal protein L22 [bacterium]|jgi:large subunit ribosomal protein L22|nr:50S ribosomal protein L22 [bacterium]
METKAIAKHVRMSPRKVRRVLDLIRGKNTVEALTILRFTPLRAADVVSKVLASAMANAEHNHQVDPRQLVVKATWADEGKTLKRFQPHAQGRAFPIMRRSSHIHVVVGTK